MVRRKKACVRFDTAVKAGSPGVAQPTSLPVDIATSHRAFESLVYGAFGVDRTGITPRFAAGLAARMLQHPRGDALAALRGTLQSHYSWLKADAARQEIRQQRQEFYDEFDVVLMPVTPTAAPPHHGKLIDRFGRHIDVDGSKRSYWDQAKWNAITNIAGTPATTISVKRNPAGLPVGVQAMGPAGGDLTTVEFAALVGAELDGYQRPPAFAR